MASPSDHGELIARLESATEGSRGIDTEIHCFIHGWRLIEVDARSGAFAWEHKAQEFVSGPLGAPYYTTSVDAALTLVPKGWTTARICENDDKSWAVELREGYLTSYTRVVFGGKNHHDRTPALALCIASLRARAS